MHFFLVKGNLVVAAMGYGGQFAIADPNTGLSFVYLTNNIPPQYVLDPISQEITAALYRAIGTKQEK